MNQQLRLLVNLVDTADNKIGENWIDYYQSNLDNVDTWWFETLTQGICPCCKKKTSELVGAHVAHLLGADRYAYIAPICQKCNKSRTFITIPSLLPIVPIPEDSPHIGKIKYPPIAVELMKTLMNARASRWDGSIY